MTIGRSRSRNSDLTPSHLRQRTLLVVATRQPRQDVDVRRESERIQCIGHQHRMQRVLVLAGHSGRRTLHLDGRNPRPREWRVGRGPGPPMKQLRSSQCVRGGLRHRVHRGQFHSYLRPAIVAQFLPPDAKPKLHHVPYPSNLSTNRSTSSWCGDHSRCSVHMHSR